MGNIIDKKDRLIWKQPKILSGDVEIYLRDKVVGSLAYKGFLLRRYGMGEFQKTKWLFAERGILCTREKVDVKSYEKGPVLATFESGIFSNNGILKFADGREFEFKKGCWFSDEKKLIQFKTVGIIRMGGEVEIISGDLSEENVLLSLLGIFIIKLSDESNSAAIGAATGGH